MRCENPDMGYWHPFHYNIVMERQYESDCMSDTIIQSLMAWTNTDEQTILDIVRQEEVLSQVEQTLRFEHTSGERHKRLLFTNILNALPYPVYRIIADTIKRRRGQTSVQRKLDYQPNAYAQLARQMTDPPPLYIMLTHDIDTAECYQRWGDVLDVESKLGVRSANNVLTAGPYHLEKSWLDEIEQRGFEIGLHGDSHDMAIGFRDMRRVRERLQRSLDILGRQVSGYRAPALGISEALLHVLQDLGFRYDSSIKLNLYYTGGVDTAVPYLYPGTSLWQLPLTLQDDGLFRDQALTDAAALQVVQTSIDLLRPYGGVWIFNSHPLIIGKRLDFYREMLHWLHHIAKVDIILPGQWVDNLQFAQ